MALLQLSEFHSLKQSVLGTQALQLYRTTKTSETEESAFSGHESHVSTLQQDITACSEVMFRLISDFIFPLSSDKTSET